MLLRVEDDGRDVLGDVALDVIPENKGDSLALLDLDSSDEAFALHVIALLLPKSDGRAAVVVFSPLEGYIQLELDVFAVERGDFALGVSRSVRFLVENRLVPILSVSEGREDFDICTHVSFCD